MPALLTIDGSEPWERVAANEIVPLRFTVTCPADLAHGVSIPRVGHAHSAVVDIVTDGLPQNITLHPGESFTATLDVRFKKTGPTDMGDFYIQVNPLDDSSDARRELIRLPSHRFEVVPSLTTGLRVSLSRICTYGSAAKVEVVVQHSGATDWHRLEIDILSQDRVRAGITRHRKPVFRSGDEYKFDLVLTGEHCELAFAATGQGARVEQRRTLAIPATAERTDATSAFRFLEPRNLTTDRISIIREKASEEVVSQNGIYPVYGGKSRYVLTVHPSNPMAEKVKVYPAAGEVEVEYCDRVGHGWSFLMTVVDNPVMTQSVRLDYDVQVPGETLRGELYFSIRPASAKLWAVAITAGAAVTVRGALAVGSNAFRQEDFVETILTDGIELLQRSWTDSLQLLIIFIFRLGLSLADRLFCRPFQEG